MVVNFIQSIIVPEWRHLWRAWSVRLNALGLAILSVVFWDPSAALWLFNAMPASIKGLIPWRFYVLISIIIYGAAMLAKFVRQPKMEARLNETA